MPRQRNDHRRVIYAFPDDFSCRLVRFQQESGLSWAELARRVGADPLTVRRWKAGVRPNARHLLALQALADDLGLGHLLAPQGRRCETRQRVAHAPLGGKRREEEPCR